MNKLKKSRIKHLHHTILQDCSFYPLKEPYYRKSYFTEELYLVDTIYICTYVGWEHSYHYVHSYRQLQHKQERTKWYDYVDQFQEANLSISSRRRCPSNIPNPWDLERYPLFYSHHDLAWKSHTKCRKQWMKNL